MLTGRRRQQKFFHLAHQTAAQPRCCSSCNSRLNTSRHSSDYPLTKAIKDRVRTVWKFCYFWGFVALNKHPSTIGGNCCGRLDGELEEIREATERSSLRQQWTFSSWKNGDQLESSSGLPAWSCGTDIHDPQRTKPFNLVVKCLVNYQTHGC